VKCDTTFLLYRYAGTSAEIVYLAFRLYKPVLTFALLHTNVSCKTKTWIKKHTSLISFDVLVNKYNNNLYQHTLQTLFIRFTTLWCHQQ